MHHADGALVVGVLQVGVEQPQLLDQEHALVDDGAAGQAADVGLAAALLKHAAHHVQAAVKGDAGAHAGGFCHKALPDAGHAVPRLAAQNFRAGGHLPPAQKAQTLFLADDLKQLFRLVALQFVLREKEHAHAVFPLSAQGNAQPGGRFLEEFVADLQKDAHAVAGFALGVLAGAVLQMLHDLQGVVQRLVALAALDVHHRADAAVVVLKFRVVQPGGGRALGKSFHTLPVSFLSQRQYGRSAIPLRYNKKASR